MFIEGNTNYVDANFMIEKLLESDIVQSHIKRQDSQAFFVELSTATKLIIDMN